MICLFLEIQVLYLQMGITISEAGIDDIIIIQSLIQLIWKPTYRHILSEAQMDYMLDMMYSSEVLEEQFEQGHIFLLVYSGKKPVGFAGYQNNYNGNGVCKLHKLYVLPDVQGKQLGKHLFMEGKKRAIEAGQKKLLLNVNRYNKAADFYKKLGMEIEEEVNVAIGNGYYMNDYIMSMEL